MTQCPGFWVVTWCVTGTFGTTIAVHIEDCEGWCSVVGGAGPLANFQWVV